MLLAYTDVDMKPFYIHVYRFRRRPDLFTDCFRYSSYTAVHFSVLVQFAFTPDTNRTGVHMNHIQMVLVQSTHTNQTNWTFGLSVLRSGPGSLM